MTVATEKNLVTLSIDGRQVTVPAGTTIFEATRGLGASIPHYCYDKDLSIVASCRLCFVEIEKVPKLQPSCSTPVNEGMVVYTNSDKVLDARRMQMEFLLVQHPLDCPVCDQGGECKLQEYSLDHGTEDTRFRFQRRTFPKPDIGPFVDLERNRCILCSRCVRFMDEIAGNAEFALVDRGNHTYISTFMEEPLKNEFAGNTIDLCPVGALTSKVTRFRTRVWELQSVPSTCTLCAVGCSINLQHRNRTHEILRVVPRQNEAVNYRWICDIGRFGFDQFNSRERQQNPFFLNGKNERENISWAKAIGSVVSNLKEIKEKQGSSAIAGLIGPSVSNETLFLFQQFFREILESGNIDHRTEHIIYANDDGFITSVAMGAANEPFKEVREASTIFVLGSDLPNELPILHLQVRGKAKSVPLYLANFRTTRMDKDCRQVWTYKPGSELAFVLGLLKSVVKEKGVHLSGEIASSMNSITPEIVSEKTGLSQEAFTELAKALVNTDRPTILLGEHAFTGKYGVETVRYASELARVIGSDSQSLPLSLLLPQNNSRGATDMGCYPHREPGFTAVKNPGKNTTEILQGCVDGSIKALVLFNTDIVEEYPDRPLAQKALETVPYLIVVDKFARESAKDASVFLPLSAYSEEDGTYTNVAGRVQRSERALPQVEGTLSGYQILLALAERWGAGWKQVRPMRVLEMISKAVPHYAGLTWERLGAMGKDSQPATSDNFSSVLKVKTIQPATLDENAPSQYPYRLVRGRFLFDDAGEKIYAPPLVKRREPFVLEIHPDDARKLGIEEGSDVTISGALGELRAPARLSMNTQKGHVTALGSYHGLSLNSIAAEDKPWVTISQ